MNYNTTKAFLEAMLPKLQEYNENYGLCHAAEQTSNDVNKQTWFEVRAAIKKTLSVDTPHLKVQHTWMDDYGRAKLNRGITEEQLYRLRKAWIARAIHNTTANGRILHVDFTPAELEEIINDRT